MLTDADADNDIDAREREDDGDELETALAVELDHRDLVLLVVCEMLCVADADCKPAFRLAEPLTVGDVLGDKEELREIVPDTDRDRRDPVAENDALLDRLDEALQDFVARFDEDAVRDGLTDADCKLARDAERLAEGLAVDGALGDCAELRETVADADRDRRDPVAEGDALKERLAAVEADAELDTRDFEKDGEALREPLAVELRDGDTDELGVGETLGVSDAVATSLRPDRARASIPEVLLSATLAGKALPWLLKAAEAGARAIGAEGESGGEALDASSSARTEEAPPEPASAVRMPCWSPAPAA